MTRPAMAAPNPGPWRPISTAKKDGRPVLAIFRSDLVQHTGRESHERLAGMQAILRHPGLVHGDGDIGWNMAAPVGYGGFPDHWLAGWMPTFDPPDGIVTETPPEAAADAGRSTWRLVACQADQGATSVVMDNDVVVCTIPSACWDPKAISVGDDVPIETDRAYALLIVEAPELRRIIVAALESGHGRDEPWMDAARDALGRIGAEPAAAPTKDPTP